MRANLATWLGISLSVVALGYIGAQFDVASAMSAIRLAKGEWILPAVAVYVGLLPLRGLRWSRLLAEVKPISVAAATEVFVVGAMANNIMPARLGDVARAFLLSRREQLPAATTFSNVLLERIIDGFIVVGLLSGVILFAPPPSDWVASVGASMGVLFLGGLGGCFLLALAKPRALALLLAALRPLPSPLAARIHAQVALLVDGLSILRRGGPTLVILGLSLGIWLGEVAVYAFIQRAFEMQVPTSGLVLTMAILTLGLTAPSAPGFIGVFEALIVGAVALYDVERSLGLAFAITLHFCHYVPVTLLGVACVWRRGLRLKELRGAGDGGPATEGGIRWT